MNEIVCLLCQKQTTALTSIKIVRSKMDQNAPMTIPELDLLNFIGFLRGPPVLNILLHKTKT